MKVAIIGAGMAGIGTLRYYIDHINKKDMEIYLFDDSDSAGVGYPFGEDDDALLLNQRLKKMTLAPWDDKKEYVKYLKKNMPELLKHDFISRPEFGEYTTDVFLEYIKDDRVTYVPHIVTDIDVTDQYTIYADKKYDVDVVHLCIGQLPQTDIYNLSEYHKYIGTPFPIEDHEDTLLHSNSVGIIGTNLTSLDIIMYLKKHNYKNKIIVTSRSGNVPFIRGEDVEHNVTAGQFLKKEKHPTIEEFIDAFYKEVKNHGVDFDLVYKLNDMTVYDALTYQLNHIEEMSVLQTIANELAHTLRDIWNDFSLEDQKYYMKHLKGLMGQLTGPFPQETAEKIVELIESNQLIYLPGVKDVIYENDMFQIKTKETTKTTEVLVSAVGPNMTANHLADENNASLLVKKLLEKGVFQLAPLGGIQVTYPEFSVVSKQGVLNTMKLYGNLVSTTHISNSGVNLILSKIPYSIEGLYK